MPEIAHVGTDYVVRNNLTMQMRRFMRLTNPLSRTFENHAHMAALYTIKHSFV